MWIMHNILCRETIQKSSDNNRREKITCCNFHCYTIIYTSLTDKKERNNKRISMIFVWKIWNWFEKNALNAHSQCSRILNVLNTILFSRCVTSRIQPGREEKSIRCALEFINDHIFTTGYRFFLFASFLFFSVLCCAVMCFACEWNVYANDSNSMFPYLYARMLLHFDIILWEKILTHYHNHYFELFMAANHFH